MAPKLYVGRFPNNVPVGVRFPQQRVPNPTPKTDKCPETPPEQVMPMPSPIDLDPAPMPVPEEQFQALHSPTVIRHAHREYATYHDNWAYPYSKRELSSDGVSYPNSSPADVLYQQTSPGPQSFCVQPSYAYNLMATTPSTTWDTAAAMVPTSQFTASPFASIPPYAHLNVLYGEEMGEAYGDADYPIRIDF